MVMTSCRGFKLAISSSSDIRLLWFEAPDFFWNATSVRYCKTAPIAPCHALLSTRFVPLSGRHSYGLVVPAISSRVLETPLSGRIVRVIDADTLVLEESDDEHRMLRLAGIDAPEKKQPFGSDATRPVSDSVLRQDVIAMSNRQYRYGRTIAVLMSHGRDFNLAMVKQGPVWHNLRYAHEQSSAQAQANALTQPAPLLGRRNLGHGTRSDGHHSVVQ